MHEIKERAKFCFLRLFEEVDNEYPPLAEMVRSGPIKVGTYFKPIFTDLKKAKVIVNQILETVRVADHIIFYFYLVELVQEAIEREPNERTSKKLGEKSITRWVQINKELSNWLNKHITPADDLPTDDLFVSKEMEKLFIECGIKHEAFSLNRIYLSKKGFAYGMIDAFNKKTLIKFKASSRTLIKLFFKNYLGSSFKDPRRSQKGAGSITFQKGYDAAIKCIEDNYLQS